MAKTILITGASSGLGKQTSKLFHSKGWNVIATMRTPDKEQELSSLENLLVTALDVQNQYSIAEAVESGIEKFGKIDVLVNNAGYGLMGVFESATQKQILNQFEVNVFGMMAVTQAVLPHMRKNGEGVIVNISSFGGIIGLPFTSLYASSKFAVEGFSEALSHELVKFNILVKLIEPGGVHTNFRNGLELVNNKIESYNPLMAGFFERYGQPTAHLEKASPEDVAEAIYAASTDQKNLLRYLVGEDAFFYADLKSNCNDSDLLDTVRNYFIN
ncbi:SDR family oxidoreductase [Echinicola sp. 20G]|uniref:SDR family oxidoreductase n=1 Tax=Echinicola sp. 20G TaxID=2781961 RepID=UPI001910E376|nr:SDR family oxidoreductase [Echinicola sp. 20G]